LIRVREECQFSSEYEFIFLLICKLLGNQHFAFIFLCAIDSDQSSEMIKSADLMTSASIDCDCDYDDCVSKFGSYSSDKLRYFSKQTFHNRFSSE
jgi:hypothetical protein